MFSPLPRVFIPVFLFLAAAAIGSEESDPYADDPYWYRPGHPVRPADPETITVAEGFSVDRLMDIPESMGSWTALCVDPHGRLIASAQQRPGLYRVQLPPLGDSDGVPVVEKLGGVAESFGWSQGLLYAFDSLYVTVAEENDVRPIGVYRLLDTDGDDTFDDARLILPLEGAGEHGPHNLVVGPDGESLYLICGNGTVPPEDIPSRPSSTDGLDHLMPPGFESSRFTTGGWVLRFRPDGEDPELISSGLRNSYDLAFNRDGELFTFDSDMEWDLGAPWYRPTRICHLVSGGEFGWRSDAAKWPEHYEDSVGPVLNIGPGSPTGMVFGYQTRFPERYREALFLCDWTFGTIHAAFLTPNGSSYTATIEEFIGGEGLPVTDIVAANDGALYLVVGGRRLGSALYRIRYTGTEPISASLRAENPNEEQRALRREIETLHANPAPGALAKIWKHLGHPDRSLRFAARVALESQPTDSWQSKALSETDLATRLTAQLALARKGNQNDLRTLLQTWARQDWRTLDTSSQLQALRLCEMALGRSENLDAAIREPLAQSMRATFPNSDRLANREFARLLCYLQDASVIDATLDLMAQDQGSRGLVGESYYARNAKYGEAIRDMLQSAPMLDRMHYAQMLAWIDRGWSDAQRRRYLELIADALAYSKGGYWYQEFWQRIQTAFLDHLPDEQRELYAALAKDKPLADSDDTPKPIGPGRQWSVDEAFQAIDGKLRGRSLEAGIRAYQAASCITCHQISGTGGAIGPELSAVGRRFTPRDLLTAIIEPNEAVSDQYRLSVIATHSGETVSGRIISRDARSVTIAPNMMRPSQSRVIETASIASEQTLDVSTMPSGLVNGLNEKELLDLLAYLVSGGDPGHPAHQTASP